MTVESECKTLEILKGLLNLARDRVTYPCNHIQVDWMYRPEFNKRKEITCRIERDFFLPRCKHAYSITCNVLCDKKCQIREYLAGFSDSTHDSHVWWNGHLPEPKGMILSK